MPLLLRDPIVTARQPVPPCGLPRRPPHPLGTNLARVQPTGRPAAAAAAVPEPQTRTRTGRAAPPNFTCCCSSTSGSSSSATTTSADSTSAPAPAPGPPAVHFIGIGGTGLSALALFALKQGWRVTGSDAVWSERMDALRREGAQVDVGHSGTLLDAAGRPDAVVVSSAVPQDNEELQRARDLGLPIYKRDAWLAKVTDGYELLAVAGSHGKTTTTAMLATVLKGLGDDISVIVGAPVPQLPGGSNAVVGNGPRFVLEADEYDNCFLGVTPSMALVTNVEWEHVDMFPDEAAVRDVFRKFVLQVKQGGTLVLCGDSAGSKSLARVFEEESGAGPAADNRATWLDKRVPYQVVTYGLGRDNDWQALMLAPNVQGGSDYVAVHAGVPMARVSLTLPGTHNVLNSLAVLVAVSLLAIQEKRAGDSAAQLKLMQRTAEAASKLLGEFKGVSRRFEFVGVARRFQIYDDYAHHPTEVRAVLQAARQRFDRQAIWVVFQPHTYSRLAKLLEDFAPAFSAADRVIITKVYSAREDNTWNISGQDLASAITGPPAMYIPELEDVVERLSWETAATSNLSQDNTILLTLGAGDITTLGPRLIKALL